MTIHSALRSLALVLPLTGVLSGYTRANPDFDPLTGQEFGTPLVQNILGLWQATWETDPGGLGAWSFTEPPRPGAPVLWQWVFAHPLSFEFEGRALSRPLDYGHLGSFGTLTSSASWLYQLWLEPDDHACGKAHLEVTVETGHHPIFVDAQTTDGTIGRFPVCGKRMVQLVDEADGVRYQTCVDRAYPAAPDVSMLTLIFAGPRLEWAISPMPFRPDREADSGPVDAHTWWPVHEGCHPLFAKRDLADLAHPRVNAAFFMTWGADDDDLVSVQIWQDSQETGAFFQLYADGRLMTQGYRHEGLAHGLWWYFAPDGTLLAARLYALGSEIAALPVETARPSQPTPRLPPGPHGPRSFPPPSPP